MAIHAKKRKIFKRQLLLYTTGPNVTKFLVELTWAEGIKIYTIPQDHMTNMVKTFKSLLHQNQLTNDLETWYVALGTQVLPCA